MVDHAAVPQKIIAHNGNGGTVRTACDVERIASQSTHKVGFHIFVCTCYIKPVIAFHGIGNDFFNTAVGDQQAATPYSFAGNDDIISEFRSHDGQGIISVAPGNSDRCIDHVGNKIRALAPVDIGERRLGIIWIDFHKSPHPEGIVIFFTIQEQFCLV